MSIQNKLTNAVLEALYWRARYDQESPEIGFAPPLVVLLDEVLQDTDILKSDIDVGVVIKTVRRRLGRH
jgi:hypothetical protein